MFGVCFLIFIDVTIKGEALDPRVCTVEGVVVTYVTALLIIRKFFPLPQRYLLAEKVK